MNAAPSPLAGEGEGGGMSTERARVLRKNPTEAERVLFGWRHTGFEVSDFGITMS